MEDHIRRALEAIERAQRYLPDVQRQMEDAARAVDQLDISAFQRAIQNAQNVSPEVQAVIDHLQNIAWPEADIQLFQQTLDNIDLDAVRRFIDENLENGAEEE